MLLHVNFALKIHTTVVKEEIRRASIAQLVGFLLSAVPSVWLVGQERMVLVVKVVFPVNIEQVVWNQRRVVYVPLVSVKAIQDRRRVHNAVPVNSMTVLVRLPANHVPSRPFTGAKEETPRA